MPRDGAGVYSLPAGYLATALSARPESAARDEVLPPPGGAKPEAPARGGPTTKEIQQALEVRTLPQAGLTADAN